MEQKPLTTEAYQKALRKRSVWEEKRRYAMTEFHYRQATQHSVWTSGEGTDGIEPSPDGFSIPLKE